MSNEKKQEKAPEQKQEVRAEPQLMVRADDVAEIAAQVSSKMYEAILPSLIAQLSKGQVPQAQPAGRPARVAREARRTCHVCGWFLADQKSATGECTEHDYIVVYPKDESLGDLFVVHGVKISGVKFTSQSPSDAIAVPKGAKDSILHAVQEWERAEKEMVQGRTRRRNGASATVSPKGVQQNPIGAHSPAGWS